MDLLTTYEISLDMVKTNYVVIKAKQYDKNSRVIKIHCTENGREFILNDELVAFVQMIKPDGNIYEKECTINQDENILLFNLEEQATTTAGICKAELVLVKPSDNTVLSTMIFNIIVIDGLITQEDIISQTEFGTLASLIIGYDEAKIIMETYGNAVGDWGIEEQQREINEQNRVSAENIRITNDLANTERENSRIANENIRVTNEETRVSNENARLTAETERLNAENERINAENIRISNENQRVANEELRVELYNTVSNKLANGEFDGRTVLYGNGIPSQNLGQAGDVYINTEYSALYPYYLFTKDENDWTPRWTMIGLNGTDTMPLLGTLLYPSDQPAPAGYEDVVGSFTIRADLITDYDAANEELILRVANEVDQ